MPKQNKVKKECKHIWVGERWQPDTQKCSKCDISWRKWSKTTYPEINKVKKVKVYVIHKFNTPITNIFSTRKEAKEFLHQRGWTNAGMKLMKFLIVPCTITYTLPITNKKK